MVRLKTIFISFYILLLFGIYKKFKNVLCDYCFSNMLSCVCYSRILATFLVILAVISFLRQNSAIRQNSSNKKNSSAENLLSRTSL